MSKSYSSHIGKNHRSARMLGIGAVIVGTLAGCSTNSNPAPAPTAAPTLVQVQSTPTTAPSTTQSPTQPASPINTAEPTTAPAPAPAPTAASNAKFKDGEYVGDATRVDRWGDLQVRAVVQSGHLAKIDIVVFPHSTRRSNLISEAALPTLVSEAIQNQDEHVDVVSRATDTSVAFIDALGSALSQAAVAAP